MYWDSTSVTRHSGAVCPGVNSVRVPPTICPSSLPSTMKNLYLYNLTSSLRREGSQNTPPPPRLSHLSSAVEPWKSWQGANELCTPVDYPNNRVGFTLLQPDGPRN